MFDDIIRDNLSPEPSKESKIDQKKLTAITQFLAENVFRNADIMFEDLPGVTIDGCEVDLTDIIASLHNLLCEAVTGNRYNYMFHWANKIGSWTLDNIFDDDFKDEYDKL